MSRTSRRLKLPTTIKIGDKEVVKARPFTRLQTTLTMTPTGFADAVPPFNPLKLTNRADVADTAPDPGPAQDDAEVAFRTQDLRPSDAEQASGELSQAEAQAQVVEMLKAPPDAPKASGQTLAPQLLLMRTSQAAGEPSARFPPTQPSAASVRTPLSLRSKCA